MICVNCDNNLEERLVDFPSEIKGECVIVPQMKAFVCLSCGYKTILPGEIAEFMRLAADVYRRQHNLLTSDDIRSRRRSLQMNQDEFARHLEVGVASVKRWEFGQVQDKAMDLLIRIRTSRSEAFENYSQVSRHLCLGVSDSFVYSEKNEQWGNLGQPKGTIGGPGFAFRPSGEASETIYAPSRRDAARGIEADLSQDSLPWAA